MADARITEAYNATVEALRRFCLPSNRGTHIVGPSLQAPLTSAAPPLAEFTATTAADTAATSKVCRNLVEYMGETGTGGAAAVQSNRACCVGLVGRI